MTLNNIYIFSFTALALALGAVVAWEDYLQGKIRNRWILTGLAGGILLQAGFTFYVLFLIPSGNSGITGGYLMDVFLNTAIAFACGVAMWKFTLWSAGDAKLFVMFAFLTPLEYYSRGYMDYFPAFNLLINIFAVSFAFVILKILFGLASPTEKAGEAAVGKSESGIAGAVKVFSERWPQLLLMFAIFNAVMLGMNALRPMIGGGQAGQVALGAAFLLFIYFAIKPISRKLDTFFEKHPGARPWALAVIPAALLLTMMTGSSREVAGTAKTTAGFMIAAGLIRKLMETRLGKTDVARVKVKDLRNGMFPTEASVEEISKSVPVGTVFMDGLTAEQADAIREGMDGEKEIEIYRTMAFAPAALGGLALTFFLKQSVVHYLIGVYRG